MRFVTHRKAEAALADLVAVLDTQELSAACERLQKGFGLRVVK